ISMNVTRRRTLIKRQGVTGEIVLAPQILIPSLENLRITLIPSSFSGPCSSSVKTTSSASAEVTASLAGALKTPNLLSLLAYTPAVCPEGGTRICPLPNGLEMEIQGKYKAA